MLIPQCQYRGRKKMQMLPYELTTAYSNAVAKYGPDSSQARDIRAANAGNADFSVFADSVDEIKRLVGGSGIDFQPAGDPSTQEPRTPVGEEILVGV